MPVAEILFTLLRLALLCAGLIVPGGALLRALGLPWSLGGSVLLSLVTLYVSVVAFALASVPISLGSLAPALVLVTLLARWRARRIDAAPADESPRTRSLLTDLGGGSGPYLLFWAVILWRLATQPLTGADVDFRWSWLAEQMLRTGTLDFYPPLTAADFLRYVWVESIPPGAASAHAWAYACAGGTSERWAVAGILLQLLALHDLVGRLGFTWGGRGAARLAILLVAAMPLLSWGVIMGQETGFTALAATGLCLGLVRWRQTGSGGWLAFAALASALGASAREYGIIFPFLGLGLLLGLRAPRRALAMFGLIALPLALAWPLRIWTLTGNPFYSLGVGRLFPVHAFFVEWAATISAGSVNLLLTPAGWSTFVRYLLLFAPAAACGWIALAIEFDSPPASVAADRTFSPRSFRLIAGASVAVIGLIWFASIPYTGGGLFYSMRVLTPAFALGAVGAGWALSRWTGATHGGWTVTVSAILVLATLPATLTLPLNPIHLPPREWAAAGRFFVDQSRATDAALGHHLQTLPAHDRIVSECVSLPRSLAPSGIAVIPLWSPEVGYLFDSQLPPAEIARRWAASGLRYIVMTRSPPQLEWLARRAAWRQPFLALKPIWNSEAYVIFEVTTAAPHSGNPAGS